MSIPQNLDRSDPTVWFRNPKERIRLDMQSMDEICRNNRFLGNHSGIASAISALSVGIFCSLDISSLFMPSVIPGGKIITKMVRSWFQSLESKIVQHQTELYKQSHLSIPTDKNVALILEATYDRNQAFQSYFPHVLEKKYSVVFRRVSDIRQINQAIEEVSRLNRIKILWIRGHGSPLSIRLSDSHWIMSFNIYRIAECIDRLVSDAVFVLDSCETGMEGGIAQEMSQWTRGRPVIASKVSFCYSDLRILSLDPLQIKIKSFRWENESENWNKWGMVLVELLPEPLAQLLIKNAAVRYESTKTPDGGLDGGHRSIDIL